MEFGVLRSLIPDSAWQGEVDRLLDMKRVSDEKATVEPVPLLNNWIAGRLGTMKERVDQLPTVHHDTDELDILFRKYIGL